MNKKENSTEIGDENIFLIIGYVLCKKKTTTMTIN